MGPAAAAACLVLAGITITSAAAGAGGPNGTVAVTGELGDTQLRGTQVDTSGFDVSERGDTQLDSDSGAQAERSDPQQNSGGVDVVENGNAQRSSDGVAAGEGEVTNLNSTGVVAGKIEDTQENEGSADVDEGVGTRSNSSGGAADAGQASGIVSAPAASGAAGSFSTAISVGGGSVDTTGGSAGDASVAPVESTTRPGEQVATTKDPQLSEARATSLNYQQLAAIEDPQLSEARARAESLEDELARMRTALGGAEAQNKLLEGNLSRVDGENKELALKLASVQASLEEAQAKIAKAEQDLKDHRDEDSIELEKCIGNAWAAADRAAEAEADAAAALRARDKETAALKSALEDMKEKYADPSLQHFLNAKADKVYHHPGIQGARNKTFTYVLPHLRAGQLMGIHWLNTSQSAMDLTLSKYLGQDRVLLHRVTGFLAYGLVVLPLLLSAWCLLSIRRVALSLRLCLIFSHMNLSISSGIAGVFALVFHADPLHEFAVHDSSEFLATQAVFAIVYFMYFSGLLAAWCLLSQSVCEWRVRCAQLIWATTFAVAYFFFVWSPAMQDQAPLVADGMASLGLPTWIWMPYVFNSLAFLVMIFLERLVWRMASDSSVGKGEGVVSIELGRKGASAAKMLDDAFASIVGVSELEAGEKQD